jgi:DNA mismatch repair protein MutL
MRCYNSGMPIRILPPSVASQIAAGEVVERPASVVKELIENALDAHATEISVSIEGAGQRLIAVADDGDGIPADELPLAVSRHATSKLAAAEDLFHISSLGFRGEALASIASVSRLTITSRSSSSPVGARLQVEGGLAQPPQAVGAPPGTLVRVEDLFFNVPARKKFLKSDATERRLIDELVTRYALAYPRTRFHLRQDGRAVLQTSGNGDRREVLAALYGFEVARQLLEVLAEYDDLRVSGFISPLSYTRTNRREITLFVNGRWIQDVALTAAVVQAYHTMIMVGRFPMATIFLELLPEAVDVNVHPAKAAVRFRDRERVFSGVQRAVRRALMAHAPVPGLEAGSEPIRLEYERLGWESERTYQKQGGFWGLEREDSPDLPADSEQAAPGTPRLSLLRLVGQVAAAYLVAEGPDGLYLIDQHAAHERVLYERFQSQRSAGVQSQALLEPVAVELPPAQSRVLADQLATLDHLGFRVEPFGANMYLVRAIPALLAGIDPATGLRTLVEDFEEDETPLQAEVEARLIARVCKRAAVKAGQILSPEEQKSLLNDLERCQSPRTCPHGRPTMIHLSVDLLERQFGRRGAR